MPKLKRYKDSFPSIDPNAWIADGSNIIGDVVIGACSSVWFQCTLRADVNKIRIGRYSNIQDGSVVHVNGSPSYPTLIGDYVTVGHGAILHGCTLEDECLVGMGATILNGAIIKTGAIVAAGSLVREGQVVEKDTLVAGVPAKVLRSVTAKEKEGLRSQPLHYWNDIVQPYLED